MQTMKNNPIKTSFLLHVMNIFRTGCTALLCLGAMIFSEVQALNLSGKAIVGPLVGHATSSTASLWMYAGVSSRVSIHYLPVDGKEAEKQAEFIASIMPAKRLSGQPFKITLTDLKPQMDYQYRISIDGKFQPFVHGIFRTAPIKGKNVKFRVGVTSCMKVGKPQSSWKLFLAENPTLHLTLGDTHYANSTDPNKQWNHHLRYRRELNFSKVIAAIPTYAMWDDHDYGPNDSDGSERGKESSLESWKAVWANPNAGTERTPGAFFKFSWGDVDFFVIDERYYRSPNKARDDDRKRMLGDPQFEWLLNGLKSSKAKFKIIASGSTLHHSTTDGLAPLYVCP